MLNEIIDNIDKSKLNLTVERAVIGLGYVAVQVDGHAGICATLADQLPGGCGQLDAAGSLAGSTLEQIFKLPGQLGRALSIAAINALHNQGESSGDIFSNMAINKGDRIVMVGCIAPLLNMFSKRDAEVVFFDKRESANSQQRSANQMPQYIEQADIILITATALLNNTLKELLELDTKAREIILIGPSTPMLPQLFAAYGVTGLGGAQVLDSDKACQIIMEGGGTQSLYRQGAMQKSWTATPASGQA